MKIKAERIEQLIQIANRNLLLIQSHQADNVTPLGIYYYNYYYYYSSSKPFLLTTIII